MDTEVDEEMKYSHFLENSNVRIPLFINDTMTIEIIKGIISESIKPRTVKHVKLLEQYDEAKEAKVLVVSNND